MNNTATNTATCPTVRKQIGKTTYIVRVHFSQTAKKRQWRTKSSLLREVEDSAKCDELDLDLGDEFDEKV